MVILEKFLKGVRPIITTLTEDRHNGKTLVGAIKMRRCKIGIVAELKRRGDIGGHIPFAFSMVSLHPLNAEI